LCASAPLRRVAASILALSVTACAPNDGVSPGATPDKVRAVVLPLLFTAPFHIAAAEGYFADEGLDVEFVRLTRNIDAIPALAQGEVDVGAGQLTVAMLNAMSGGAHIRVVVDSGHLAADGCTFAGIVARRELLENGEMVDAERLRGRRLEVDVALPQAYWLDGALRSVGLGFDDMEIVNVPTAATVEAFLNDAYDLTSVTEPRITQMVGTGEGAVWLGVEELFPDYPQNLVFFGPSLLDERPEVGERFIAAYLRGIRQYNQGKTERNLEILESALRLSRDELTAACWASMHDDGEVPAAGLTGYQEWAVAQGLIEQVMPEDEILDRRFIEAASVRPSR
jgi:NitT/TauT family transport system substrate-binding protein